jgi:hypothetical protein
MQDRSRSAHGPPALVARKVHVNQLVPGGDSLAQPRRTAVVRIYQQAIDHHVAATDGADNPSLLLARKPYAVEFQLRAAELVCREAPYLSPLLAAVARVEDAVAHQDVALILAAKVDVVDGLVGSNRLLRPGAAPVLRAAHETVVAGDPPAFLVCEKDRVQIPARLAALGRSPTGSLLRRSSAQSGRHKKKRGRDQPPLLLVLRSHLIKLSIKKRAECAWPFSVSTMRA